VRREDALEKARHDSNAILPLKDDSAMTSRSKRTFILALGGFVAIRVAPVHAQAARMPKIGLLSGSAETGKMEQWFIKGMGELGYEEGRNVRYESRHGDGSNETALRNARDLMASKVDVIWAPGTQVTTAARKVTSTVPIVFALVSDPVASGFVRSLARPGTNTTGITVLNAETGAKRIELLNEIFPKLTRVGVLHNPGDSASTAQLSIVTRAAQTLKKEVLVVEARSADEFAPAFARLAEWRTDALVILENALYVAHRQLLLDQATQRRWPTINSSKEYAEAGGIIAYGADWSDSCRRSAVYVDKILKGAKPADLPVEQPTKFEFVINLKAARAMGLSIPRAVLVRADRVIE